MLKWLEEFYWYLYNHSVLFREIRYFILYVVNIKWYWYIVSVGIIILTIVIAFHHDFNRNRAITLSVLVTYVFLLYASLVFSRPVYTNYQLNISVFWTLRAVINGEYKYVREIIQNLLMLIPIGMLLPLIINKNLRWIIRLGCLISLSIELLQLITKTGLCEIDDVIYNTISVAIGYFLYKVISRIKKNWRIR